VSWLRKSRRPKIPLRNRILGEKTEGEFIQNSSQEYQLKTDARKRTTGSSLSEGNTGEGRSGEGYLKREKKSIIEETFREKRLVRKE